MSLFSTTTKYCLFYIIFINFICVNFGGIVRQKSIDDDIPDMKIVVNNEEVPKFSRRDLIDIIQRNQFFQDIFFEAPDPTTVQFGHVCENPQEWEQRFEQRDFKNNHYQGKMSWGNKNGDYGEHYWDLGHVG